ncbi:hypothetical protein D3C81_2298910 [compost metagenome]
MPAYFLTQLPTVFAGHHHINDGQMHQFGLQQKGGLIAILGFIYDVAFFVEIKPQQLADMRIVISD